MAAVVLGGSMCQRKWVAIRTTYAGVGLQTLSFLRAIASEGGGEADTNGGENGVTKQHLDAEKRN